MNRFITPAEMAQALVDAFECGFGPNWREVVRTAWNEAIRQDEIDQDENDAKA